MELSGLGKDCRRTSLPHRQAILEPEGIYVIYERRMFPGERTNPQNTGFRELSFARITGYILVTRAMKQAEGD